MTQEPTKPINEVEEKISESQDRAAELDEKIKDAEAKLPKKPEHLDHPDGGGTI